MPIINSGSPVNYPNAPNKFTGAVAIGDKPTCGEAEPCTIVLFKDGQPIEAYISSPYSSGATPIELPIAYNNDEVYYSMVPGDPAILKCSARYCQDRPYVGSGSTWSQVLDRKLYVKPKASAAIVDDSGLLREQLERCKQTVTALENRLAVALAAANGPAPGSPVVAQPPGPVANILANSTMPVCKAPAAPKPKPVPTNCAGQDDTVARILRDGGADSCR